jgi:AcrR family transcriptional regulator
MSAARAERRASPGVADRILAEARAVLVRDGYDALTIEGVAAATGIAKTTIYRRFRNKADLATAACAPLTPAFTELTPADPRAALEAVLIHFRDVMRTRVIEVLGAMLIARDPELARLHRERVIAPRTDAALVVLHEAQERGLLRSDVDIEIALDLAMGSYLTHRLRGGRDDDDWPARVVDTLWRGIGPA